MTNFVRCWLLSIFLVQRGSVTNEVTYQFYFVLKINQIRHSYFSQRRGKGGILSVAFFLKHFLIYVPRIEFVFALDFKAKCRLGNMHRLEPALVRCPSGVTRGSPQSANLAPRCTIVAYLKW